MTSAPTLKKSDGELNPALSAEVLARKVRAFDPWPGAFIIWKLQPLKVHRATVVAGKTQPGQHSVTGGQPALGTAEGLLMFEEVQPAGKKLMSGAEFLRGARDWVS